VEEVPSLSNVSSRKRSALKEVESMNVTAFDIAQRFVGIKEVHGKVSNPAILAMLQLDQAWPDDDEVPWCSAFVNYVAWLLRLPRSKSLAARSWLNVGRQVRPEEAQQGNDVVVLSRGSNPASGHVGLFAGWGDGIAGGPLDIASSVFLLGGNQGNAVSIAEFPVARLLGVRRLDAGLTLQEARSGKRPV
jgi:uncharacterized protein (TIGR02594 family)